MLALGRADEISATDAQRALTRAVAALNRAQDREGAWPDRARPEYGDGLTCLVTFALLSAGEPPDAPHIQRALARVRGAKLERVYTVALKIMTLAQTGRAEYRDEVIRAAHWLIAAQNNTGLWHYTQKQAGFDHSNSQFALLALHTAAEFGVKIPGGVWNEARLAVLRSQGRDGGWGYQSGHPSSGSMTAANVCNLFIFGAVTEAGREKGFENGAAARCGEYQANRPLMNGINWLARNFRADQNPPQGPQFTTYWLYAIERAGIFSARRTFGEHDWYRAGAEFLVRTQRGNGHWTNDIADTAFATLFLAKGRKPLLVQKLKWSNDSAWNPDRYDVERLVAYAGDRLGQLTTWQVVEFDAPLEEWLAAPLLYMQGHTFPEWDAGQRSKVRKYIEQGGTLLAEACCGRAEFREGFERFARETFPEFALRELDASHPLYSASFDLAPAGVQGIDAGCRTSVFFSPRDLSCLWEQGDLPELSEPALQLGVNLAAFAAGQRPLRDKLDLVTLPSQTGGPALVAGDALRLGQVVYRGDWQPDPHALEHLGERLAEQAGLNMLTQYRPVQLTDDDLYASPILYMTGHYGFELSAREQERLAEHLRRGGFLLADACCGRQDFDAAFRALMARAFPANPLTPMPANHPILRGAPGTPLPRIAYRAEALRESPGLSAPELWTIELNNRTAVVYSPYSLGCGWDGHACAACRGVGEEDARRIGVNAVLYALSH